VREGVDPDVATLDCSVDCSHQGTVRTDQPRIWSPQVSQHVQTSKANNVEVQIRAKKGNVTRHVSQHYCNTPKLHKSITQHLAHTNTPHMWHQVGAPARDRGMGREVAPGYMGEAQRAEAS
jgi:hypothetical protein